MTLATLSLSLPFSLFSPFAFSNQLLPRKLQNDQENLWSTFPGLNSQKKTLSSKPKSAFTSRVLTNTFFFLDAVANLTPNCFFFKAHDISINKALKLKCSFTCLIFDHNVVLNNQ